VDRHRHQTAMTRPLTAGAGVGPRAWRSRGPSDHADTQLVGHSWHTRSVAMCGSGSLRGSCGSVGGRAPNGLALRGSTQHHVDDGCDRCGRALWGWGRG
jgi:hypothetical protein